VKKDFKVRLTRDQVEKFLKWEHEHQMKLFPWMEEEDEDAGQGDGDIPAQREPTGGDGRADFDF
jgi:hypothetical protein